MGIEGVDMESKTYTEWVSGKGEASELVIKAIETDRILEEIPRVSAYLGKLLGDALAKKLSETGHRFGEVKIATGRDWSSRANEYAVILESIQGDTPVEYLSLAYHAWQEEQRERVNWENKSLWEYIKHCWNRRRE